MAIEFTSKKVSVINPEYAYVMRHMDNEPALFTGDFLHKEVPVGHFSFRLQFQTAFLKAEKTLALNQVQKDEFRAEFASFSRAWEEELKVQAAAKAVETLRKAEGIVDSAANAKVAELEARLEKAKDVFKQQKAEIESLKAQLTTAGQAEAVKEVTVQDPALVAENKALKAENAQLKAELAQLKAAKVETQDAEDIFDGEFEIPAIDPAAVTEEEFSFETSNDMAYAFNEEVEEEIPASAEETEEVSAPTVEEETAVDTDYQNNWGQIVFMAGGKLSETTAHKLQDAGLDAAEFEDYKDSLNSYGFSAAEIAEVNVAMAACGWL